MITIPVDEGYAYDYLAIAIIKSENLNDENCSFLSSKIDSHLLNELGNIHFKILNSKEFEKLLEANKETFEAVEKARYGKISAKEVDDCNMNRYNCKIDLQKKFFSKNKINEIKS